MSEISLKISLRIQNKETEAGKERNVFVDVGEAFLQVVLIVKEMNLYSI